MVRVISIRTIRIFTLISVQKFRIFTLISICFIKFRINTSVSVHTTRKLKFCADAFYDCSVLISMILSHKEVPLKKTCWLFAYNFLKPHNTGMHIGIQNLLSWEQKLHVSLYKTYLDNLDKFIFQKRGLKALFWPITKQKLVE